MPDDEYRTKYSAAQKMQFLKTQQAKLETREIPQHTQMRLKSQDKKKKKKWKLKKKMSQRKSRKSKPLVDILESSSSSKSKRSLTSTGSSADQIRSPIPKNEIKHSVSKVEQNEELMWKHRSKKLKEIATECEKDVELRIAMDDITAGMDVLKRKRNEHCQYVNAQNDILKKQVKLLGEFQATQIIELSNKVQQLRNTMKNIDAKLSVIFTKLKSVSVQ